MQNVHIINVAQLAGAIGVTRQTVNELLRERRAVSPSMALRLSRLFGNSAEFWLNLQRAVDLWDAETIVEQERSGALNQCDVLEFYQGVAVHEND